MDMGKTSNRNAVQLLRYLLYLALAQLALTLAGMVVSAEGVIRWVNIAVTAATALCLFGLAPLNPRLRQAAIFQLMSACGR